MRFLITLILLCVLCPLSSEARADTDTIQLGAILILSGDGAAWGTAAQHGIDLAIEDINAKGGVLGKKLAVEYQDDQGDPKRTVTAFQTLTELKHTSLIIGPSWSRTGLAVANLAAEKKALLISPSIGMAKFNEANEYLFITWPHDVISSAKLADYVYGKGHRHVAMIGVEEPWVKEQTQAFRGRFLEIGGTVELLLETLQGVTDVRTEALKIAKQKGIDALVSTTDGERAGSLVAGALKKMNVSMPMYSVTMDQQAIDAAQGGFEGMEFVSFLTPTPEFAKRYQERFGLPVDTGGDSAYDAVMMLADAIRSSGSTDATVVAKELAKVQRYHGVSGELVSDGKRAFTKDFVVLKIHNGKPVPVK